MEIERYVIALKRRDVCCECGADLPSGFHAAWEPYARTVKCLECAGPDVLVNLYGGPDGPGKRGSAMATNRLTKDQVEELVLLAPEDTALWEALKENERRLEKEAALGEDDPYPNSLDRPNMPALAMMIARFVERHGGTGEGLDHTDLIIMLRCAVREDLGLPVDLEWDFGKGRH